MIEAAVNFKMCGGSVRLTKRDGPVAVRSKQNAAPFSTVRRIIAASSKLRISAIRARIVPKCEKARMSERPRGPSIAVRKLRARGRACTLLSEPLAVQFGSLSISGSKAVP